MANYPNGEPRREAALAELARDPSSRKRFLKMMGGGVAGASALSIFLAACGGGDEGETVAGGTTSGSSGTPGTTSGSMDGDLEILNYALTLEFLESDFYAQVVDSGLFRGASAELVKTIGEHENQHVAALTQTIEQLGGTPAEKPMTNFPLDGRRAVLELAATVENLGAAAYLGQAANIQKTEILAAALSIHSVEARHAAALNLLVGKNPTPDGGFAEPASMDEVFEAVKPFIAS
jgi:hypothetical protein